MGEGVRDETQRLTTNNRGRLQGYMEIQYVRSFFKNTYIDKRNLNEIMKYRGNHVPNKQILPLSGTFSMRNGLHLVESLAKEVQ